jgi:ketosteroid isomerase-like protein
MTPTRIPGFGVYTGYDEIRAFMTEWFSAFEFDGWRMEIDELFDHGDTVLSLLRQVGHGTSSGAEVSTEFAQIFTMRAGRIVRIDNYLDRADALAALNVQLVRGMLDSFNRGDVDAVVAAFREDCLIQEPREMPDSPAQGFRGHDGVREWMANLREVAGVRFEPSGVTAGGDAVVAELAAHGLGTGSGVPVDWTTFAVLWMREGRIARAQAFLSRDEALEAAG